MLFQNLLVAALLVFAVLGIWVISWFTKEVNGLCKVNNGSTANYWDDRHMSKDGALMAAPN
jgi:hypothetical protein